MPQVSRVSSMQQTYEVSPLAVAKGSTSLSDASTLARCEQKARVREGSGLGFITFCQWLFGILVTCITCGFLAKNKENKADASSSHSKISKPFDDSNDRQFEEVKAMHATLQALRRGEDTTEEFLKHCKPQAEPRFVGDQFEEQLALQEKELNSLLQKLPTIAEKAGGFYKYADFYLQRAEKYLIQEGDKLCEDEDHKLEGAVINKIRLMALFVQQAEIHLKPQGQHVKIYGLKERHGVDEEINAADLMAVKCLRYCQDDYELFQLATGQHKDQPNPIKWQELEKTLLRFIDKILKEKIEMLSCKKSETALKSGFGILHLKDSVGFKSEQGQST